MQVKLKEGDLMSYIDEIMPSYEDFMNENNLEREDVIIKDELGNIVENEGSLISRYRVTNVNWSKKPYEITIG